MSCDQLHGEAEILGLARPARGKDAGLAAQRLDAQSAVVGERGQAGQIGGGARLQLGIGDEGGAGLLGLGQVELGGRDRFDAVGAEQIADLADLARIVAGDDQLAGGELADRLRSGPSPLIVRRPSACAAKMSAQPMRARRSRRSSSSSSIDRAFRGRLRLGDVAVFEQDEVGVGIGGRILDIIEVEHRRALMDAADDRGDLLA